jgi:hypothetical protein
MTQFVDEDDKAEPHGNLGDGEEKIQGFQR